MATKVVLIGAGSYVFTPSTLHDLICDHKLPDLEIWFVDMDSEMAAMMAGVAQRMAESVGLNIHTECTTNRKAALPDADFVSTSVAVDGIRRWQTDREVSEKHGVFDLLGELGGLGGISYTLRQVPLHLNIVRDMEQLCPNAMLLNVSNPLPRVITALSSLTSIRCYGLCNAAFGGVDGYENISRMLDRPLDSFNVVSLGTNHFNWLLKLTDATTGEDLYPEIKRRFAEGNTPSLTKHCLDEYGYLPLSGDSHIGEFFPFDPRLMKRMTDAAFHGNVEERQQRRDNLAKMAAGDMAWHSLLEHRAWEKPADIIASIVTGKPCDLPMLNLRNNGAMPEFPDEMVVEMPCRVEDGQVRACPVGKLPESVKTLCETTGNVNTIVALAAAHADREQIHAAIEIDPSITNKDGGHAAIDELIEQHRDLLTNWH